LFTGLSTGEREVRLALQLTLRIDQQTGQSAPAVRFR
jgi:hypothetical protein